jgi:hypothetical protein
MKTASNVNGVEANAGGGKETAGTEAVRPNIKITPVAKKESKKKAKSTKGRSKGERA